MIFLKRSLIGFIIFNLVVSPVLSQVTLNYRYDENGNVIEGDGKYYEYDDSSRLVLIRHGGELGPVIAEFFYDHNGNRVKKIENSRETYYVGKHYEEIYSPGLIEKNSHFFNGLTRMARKNSQGELIYFHTDHLGSNHVLTNSRRVIQETTRYLPFGGIREEEGERYGYTGKERDTLLG